MHTFGRRWAVAGGGRAAAFSEKEAVLIPTQRFKPFSFLILEILSLV